MQKYFLKALILRNQVKGRGEGGGERGVGSDALPETGLNERFVDG